MSPGGTKRAKRLAEKLPADLPADDTGPAEAFDRAWARALLREAARVQEENARQAGPAAFRRVQLLRLRFQDNLPIREIAALWNEDPAKLHHEYATARAEFRTALLLVVAFHHPGVSSANGDRLASELLELLV